MKTFKSIIILCILSFSFLNSALAKNISVIIPFSTGGPTDRLWREIEPFLNERLLKHGIKLITENVPGAGGTIAANKILDSTDKLVLGFFSPALVISPVMNSDVVRYDKTSFNLIGYAGSTEMVVVSHLSLTVFEDKCKNGTVFYGSSNIGSTSHLLGYIVTKELKCKDPVHVPYKGISAAYADLLGGRIDFIVDFSIHSSSQIKQGGILELFKFNDRFPNTLDSWHVFISNKKDTLELKLIEAEFLKLKQDSNFVKNLENKFLIMNFSSSRNQYWFEQEFEIYKKYIQNIK